LQDYHNIKEFYGWFWATLLFVTYYSPRSRSASTVFFRSPIYLNF